ncbi:MAG: SAM-dependent methyltransferase [Clostridia bacterium]|jgi:tRNA (adenine22-N1)-methyltransferase|nr:SAM-dependent methyltransferase [Clostridia bacterium]
MKRLDLILSLLTPGCRIADIGCDHAYVPISAVSSGVASFAYASDVREGPLSRARENVGKAGLSDKIVLALADGLDGADKYGTDTVIIAGMGGELTAEIIDRAPFVKDQKIKLILQPMTAQDKLRRYLLGSGFEIMSEHISKEGARVYQMIVCKYTGKPQSYTDAELIVGKNHVEKELVSSLYKKYITKYEKIVKGKAASDKDLSFDEKILCELKEKYGNVNAL